MSFATEGFSAMMSALGCSTLTVDLLAFLLLPLFAYERGVEPTRFEFCFWVKRKPNLNVF